MNSSDILEDLLKTLCQQMHAAKLWQDHLINGKAFESKMPFCADTMTFQQWLQFVFVPKMMDILANEQPVPKRMALAPMGEQAFAQIPNTQSVIKTLRMLDQFCTTGEIKQ